MRDFPCVASPYVDLPHLDFPCVDIAHAEGKKKGGDLRSEQRFPM